MPRKVTIILIDSEMLLLDLLGDRLRAAGAGVLVANSINAGMELYRAAGRTAAVIAVNPNLPGFHLFLRDAGESFPATRVLALADSDKTLEFARNNGIDVVDKRQHLAAVFEHLRLAAKLPEHSCRQDEERVLVVDDEEHIRNFLCTFLEMRGYSTSTAKDGVDALSLLREDGGFGVVLLDIIIPQKGGMEVLADLQHFRPRPAVIMMTAVADAEVARQALKQGAFNYILKPLNLPELESNVSACFSRPQYRKNRFFSAKGGTA